MKYRIKLVIIFLFATLLISCSKKEDPKNVMDKIAKSFVEFSLRAGQIDPDFVDAYYGPADLKPSDSVKVSAEELQKSADSLLIQLAELDTTGFDGIWKLRYNYLMKEIIAGKTRLDIVTGNKISFDDQAKLLFDTEVPHNRAAYFDSLFADLDKTIPGKGDITARFIEFQKHFLIPESKLDTVYKAAIAECRKRTLEHISLPSNESFEMEYVSNQPWSAYNWYKGNYHSLIQINTDLPKYIDGVLGLLAHEGYPGHHVYNALLEQKLYHDKNWIEFSIYDLFSPQSLIAEGSANYGVHLIFPGNERIEFEKKVLFPLAGLDTSLADKYYEILDLKHKLDYARNESAREYLDGRMTKEEAVKWNQKYLLMSIEAAEKSMSFVDKYQAYIINYNLGQDIVKKYVGKNAGDNLDKKWQAFIELLSTPRTASAL